jgi:hypothetical protein
MHSAETLEIEQQMVSKNTAISNNNDAITAEALARTTADGLKHSFNNTDAIMTKQKL